MLYLMTVPCKVSVRVLFPEDSFWRVVQTMVQQEILFAISFLCAHADGGSCVAAPDGSWLLEPLVGEEGIRYCDLDPSFVRRERQNFDPAGHYSRPDVTRLIVNRKRQSLVEFEDD